MKAVYPLLLLLFLAVSAAAQSSSNPSDTPAVEVIKKEWYMEINNPAFDKSPFGPIDEMQQVNQVRKAVQRQNEIRARRGLPPLRTPTRVPQPEPDSGGKRPDVYTYKVKFRNNGEKAIEALIWDYVFFEPGTEKEVGRLQFVSKGKISPGKTKDFSVSSLSPPSDAINVKVAGKKLRDQYAERVVIQSIEFGDGSFWDAGAEPPK